MKNLYAPWRSDYAQSTNKAKESNISSDECIFCTQLAQDNDPENFILKRTDHATVFFNRYPYNAGHLMIIPKAHKAHLSDLQTECRTELMELVNASIEIIKKHMNPDGFNVGLNLGKEAGAGIPSHLHMHVLPRWRGDTNFLPTLAQTKAISFDLAKMYKKLKPDFDILEV